MASEQVPVKTQHHQSHGAEWSLCFYLALVFFVSFSFVPPLGKGTLPSRTFRAASYAALMVSKISYKFSENSDAPSRKEIGMRRALVRAHPGPSGEPTGRLLAAWRRTWRSDGRAIRHRHSRAVSARSVRSQHIALPTALGLASPFSVAAESVDQSALDGALVRAEVSQT